MPPEGSDGMGVECLGEPQRSRLCCLPNRRVDLLAHDHDLWASLCRRGVCRGTFPANVRDAPWRYLRNGILWLGCLAGLQYSFPARAVILEAQGEADHRTT